MNLYDSRRLRSRATIAHLAAICAVLACGCSSLTDAAAFDVVQPAALDNPAGAEVLRLGAIGLFSAAYAGSADLTQVTASGLISDELFSASETSTNRVDQRAILDASPAIYYPYAVLQRAHANALQAIYKLQMFSASRRAQIGQLFALVGYTEIFLAENLCSGVPISPVANGQPTVGQPLSTIQILERAIVHFDSALTYAADSARLANMARVGRARAQLDMGRHDSAATTAASVPTEYVYATQHSASTQENSFFSVVNLRKSFTVADREGRNGIDFISGRDPRVPTVLIGKGTDRFTDIYAFGRYSSSASSVVLASGVEARLIESEAALRSGRTAQFIGIMTALRADPSVRAQYGISAGTLGPLILPTTLAEQVDLLFRERALWLFGTGHRHGDLRRLVRQYGRAVETVFPTGMWKQGQAYGTAVTLPPDLGERNNPSYSKCASQDA